MLFRMNCQDTSKTVQKIFPLNDLKVYIDEIQISEITNHLCSSDV